MNFRPARRRLFRDRPLRAVMAVMLALGPFVAVQVAAAGSETGATPIPASTRSMCLPPVLQEGPVPGPVARWAAPCGTEATTVADANPADSSRAAASGEVLPPCTQIPPPDDLIDDVCEEWVGTYDNTDAHTAYGYGADSPADFVVSPDGERVFVTGVSWGGGEADFDWATVAFDSSGQRLWVARRGTVVAGQFTGMDFPQSIAVGPDGDVVYVTGMHDFHLDSDYAGTAATVAYDASTGEELWVAMFDGPEGADFLDIGTAVATSPDGARVFVAAQSQTGPTPPTDFGFGQYPSDYATIAYDAETGEEVWVSRFGGTADGYRPFDIATDPDGEALYVTGQAPGGKEIATVAYSTGSSGDEGGALRWIARHASDQLQEVGNLVVTSTRVFVSGSSMPQGGSDFRLLLLAYDTDGREAWMARYPEEGSGGGYLSRIAASPDGDRVFLSGILNPLLGEGFYGNPDYGVAAYDAEAGTQLWSSAFDGAAGSGAFIDIPRAIGVSPDGEDVYVTGQSGAATSWTYWGFDLQPAYIHSPYGSAATTVVLDATTGAEDWVARFNPTAAGEGGGFGYGIAFGPDPGRAYVLGGISSRGAVDNWIEFMCGSGVQTCPPLEANLADYAVLAYDGD